MNKKIAKNFLISVAFFSMTISQAHAALICTGKIDWLGLDQGGQIAVSNGGSGIHTICNPVDRGNFQITPQACKMFYATLLANKIAGQPVRIYYKDPSPTSCNQIGSWSVQPSAYFIDN
jgi:hypothetical protein